MKLVIKEDKVAYLYRAGKDLVSGQLSATVATAIMKGARSKVKDEDHPGYICVNGQWYFPIVEGQPEKPQKPPKSKGKKKKV